MQDLLNVIWAGGIVADISVSPDALPGLFADVLVSVGQGRDGTCQLNEVAAITSHPIGFEREPNVCEDQVFGVPGACQIPLQSTDPVVLPVDLFDGLAIGLPHWSCYFFGCAFQSLQVGTVGFDEVGKGNSLDWIAQCFKCVIKGILTYAFSAY